MFSYQAILSSVDEAELIVWCRDRLTHFKCPREVRFVAELPRLPTGKLLKRDLRALEAEGDLLLQFAEVDATIREVVVASTAS